MTPALRLPAAALAAALLGASPVLAQGAPQPAADTATATLQARVRQRMATVVQARLGLTDDQMRQLATVNARYETQRRDLVARERTARVALRGELRQGQSADQGKVQSSLDELFRIQRQRIDVAEQEQRDLAKFMQPSQRAGYLALQEQIRRRIEAMRLRREAAVSGASTRNAPRR